MTASAAPAPTTSASVSTPGAPSAAVTALNAQRAANVAAGQSAYTGTSASLSSFTSANPTLSSAGGSGGGPVEGFNSDNTPKPSAPTIGTTGASASPAIVTSGQSRTNYADNVTKLNTALNNVGNNGSIVDYLNKSGLPSDYASRSTMAENAGITGYTGTASQNLQLLRTLQNGGNSSSGNTNTSTGPAKNGTTSPSPQPNSSGPSPDSAPPTTPANTNPGAGSTTNTDGSTTNTDDSTTNADGSTTDSTDPTSGLPPALASEYKGILTNQDQAIETAQTNLAAAATSVNNDPAATAAATAISESYGTLITAMQQKNQEVLGRAQAGEAAFGGLGVMPQTFMSDEMDAASGRIADLVGKEQSALLKSNTAYQNDDVKAFNDAQTALNSATTAKKETLNTLLTATQKQVTETQAQQKIDAATTKAALTSDVTTSAKIAAGMAQALSTAGITDPTQVADYVAAMAQKNGITNTDILQSALVTAQQVATKADLSAANTKSEIQKRGSTGTKTSTKGSGTDGGFNYTSGDVATYTSLLNEGGTAPNGTQYAKRGSDGFVDPGAYTAALNDWVAQKGTPLGFAKKFPVVGNVNPSSYSELPAAVQPKAKATAAAYTA